MNAGQDQRESVAGSLLAYLESGAQGQLLAHGVRRSFAADEVLLRYGDPTDHVFVLVHGWVRVSVSAQHGQQILFALRGPGDVLGDLAALHPSWPRTATVRALDTVGVVQLTGEQFVATLHARPAIAIGLVRQMAGRLREAEAARVDHATLGVGQRVAAYLWRLAEQHGAAGPEGIVIGMPLTQQDLADRVGSSLRAVARAMAWLRERHIVITSRRRIVVTGPEVLRRLARSAPDGTELM
ncbi:MAG TPA: Crp/Fnr family transcriptional regulator [Pseudonocardiaceae bacterium]|jgi:CRP-like cAMP-binding protein|nr:Crp/Fnr family transcriptional regulator [Pseudonocardiaceae bacterium]